MNYQNFNKKPVLLTVGILFLLGAVYKIYEKFAPKTDDWVYSGPAFGGLEEFIGDLNIYHVIGYVVAVLLLPYLMYKLGRLIVNKNLESRALRIVGGIIKWIGKTFLYLYLVISLALAQSAVLAFIIWLLVKNFDIFSSVDYRDTVMIFTKYFLIAIFCVGLVLLISGIVRLVIARRRQTKSKWGKRFIVLGLSQAMMAILFFVAGNFAISTTSSTISTGSLSYGSAPMAGGGGANMGFALSDSMSLSGASMKSGMASTESIGFSVGGAKDVNNFRENIKKDYLPVTTDLTYEGLFYDYYFDTGQTEECKALFCPSYTYAVSNDPFSGKEEYFLSVGLNSGMKEADFKRKKLNLVIVLDISGSMGSNFKSYYYDRFNKKQNIEAGEDEDRGKSKMQIANEAVVGLIDHLEPDDRFSMVLFDDDAFLAKPLNLVRRTDMESIKNHILEITDQGGTNMSAGMEMGTEQFDEFLSTDKSVYENRIIFLTDAMPNRGETGEDGLIGMTKRNADNGIFSTFIGIGVDFNTELIELITKVRGANYYSVHSSKEFKTRMDDEFEFMVTPLVFDLELNLEATGYKIEKVYGSPEANEATGELMRVNTLFPSRVVAGETRGGLILIKLSRESDSGQLKLRTSYKDRNGVQGGDEAMITIKEKAEYLPNTGIHKGLVLSRYGDLIRNWIYDERASLRDDKKIVYSLDWDQGIRVPVEMELGQWERMSSPLRISSGYGEFFENFRDYLENEMITIKDEELDQEIKVLDLLIENVEKETSSTSDPLFNDGESATATATSTGTSTKSINNIDSDNDGLSDFSEINIYKTDKDNPDTDGDGHKDGDEVKSGYNPNGPGMLN